MAGLVIYMLILTIFDSLDQLQDNFFSIEAVFIILLTFAVSEVYRLLPGLFNRFVPNPDNGNVVFILHILMYTGMVIIIVSGLVAGYFKFLVGYRNFITELLVFNIIYVVVFLLITLFKISKDNIFRHQIMLLNKEEQLKMNLEFELDSFKNDINPDFLFSSLESLISLIHTDIKTADEFIVKLSKQYRYMLENKQNELVGIESEYDALTDLIYLINYKYQDCISLKSNLPTSHPTGLLVPGTLNFIAEQIIFSSIINKYQPLEIVIGIAEDNALYIQYRLNEKLEGSKSDSKRMDKINNTYEYFCGRGITFDDQKNLRTYKIPLLSVADEEVGNEILE